MKKNMGTADRIIRVLIAAVIAVLYLTGIITGTVGVVLLAVGVIFVLTALLGICPLYLLFGIRTNKKAE
jgi:hypothetical protein